LILGDSFGSGAATSQEHVWDAVFRRDYGFSTYNLSMPGYGPWHELLILKRELPRLRVGPQTTVLWAIFGGNDLDQPCPTELELPAPEGFWKRVAVRLRTFYRRSPVRQIVARSLAGLSAEPLPDTPIVTTLPDGRAFLLYSPYWRREQRSLDEVKQHPNLPRIRRVFAEMGRFARAESLNVVVVYAPAKSGVYSWLLGRPELRGASDTESPSPLAIVVDELCRENGLPFLDLQPLLIKEARRLYTESGELLWWRDDTHWNNEGHAAAARAVAEWMLARDQGEVAGSPD
jgi:hypothetical protein